MSASAELAGRAGRLAARLLELEVDALLVDSLIDLRYLAGFTGSSGAAIVFASTDGGGPEHRFLTDFRYEAQSAEQVPDSFAREIVSGDLLDALAVGLAGTSGRLGFDDSKLTVKQLARLREQLPQRWEPVPCSGAIGAMRAVKDAGEIARMRAASELADAALVSILEDGLAGRSERDVAIELELRMRRLGAEGPSFSSIVASAAHGALPHAEPRAAEIARDVLVTIDWGALHEGYCSDCTRTYATGEGISELDREIYALVLRAQEQGLAAVETGRTGKAVDEIARAVIAEAGHGEHFGHGLGHGVGMEIHEGPRLSRTGGDQPLLAGNVVTVEPGVYLPGQLGVRIEDLLVVTDDGRDVLTGLSKQLTVIA